MSLKNPILSFTVKLSKWRCGGEKGKFDPSMPRNQKSLGVGDTALLNAQGFSCCLGFACRGAGYKGSLLGKGAPDDGLKYALKGLTTIDPHSSLKDDGLVATRFTDDAIAINDDTVTTIATKMRQLIKLGEKNNIKVEFVP